MNSVKTVPIEWDARTHARTHICTHARTHARTTFAPAQYVCLWDDVIAFWQKQAASQQAQDKSLKWTRLFSLLFTVRTSTLGRFTKYIWLRVRVDHYTRRVASPLSDLWTRPFLHWLGPSFFDWLFLVSLAEPNTCSSGHISFLCHCMNGDLGSQNCVTF